MAEPTLRLYLKNGDITGSHLGKRWMFTQKDLDDFLEQLLICNIHDLKKQ